MKIACIAANGQSGQAFVYAALEAGHSVNAGIHSTNPFKSKPNLRVVKIDANNVDDLIKLTKDQDAVVTFIGHGQNTSKDVQTIAIKNTIEAIKKNKIKRLVSLTGTGVRFKGDHIRFIDHFLNLSVKLVDYYRVKDGIDHVNLIKKSKTNWTVIRVLKLQNTRPKPFILTENGPTKVITSREEVAEAVLEVLEENSFIKKAPIISSP